MKQINKLSKFILFAPVIGAILLILGIYFLGHDGEVLIYILLVCLPFILFVAKKINDKLNEYVNSINIHKEKLHIVNKTLRDQLYKDNLTKLSNLKSLDKRLKKTKNPKIILLDIDSFKEINEFYGKNSGDFVLKEMSSIIKEFANKYNLEAYRIGADEFALLDVSDFDIGKYETIVFELVKIFKTKELYLEEYETSVVINTTIGVSFESEQCFEKAQKALNFAKTHGKDFASYLHIMDTKDEYEDRIKHIKLIKKALYEDRILPFFQPIQDRNGDTIKYECLARIIDENGNIISPAKFLNTSKKARLYSLMTKRIIDKSFAMISKSNKALSFNLLPRDMMDSDINNYVIDKIRELGIAKKIVFEVLEDESIEHLQRVDNFIAKAKMLGVKIAIDDFGTGYSNFSYLLKLKPDYLKIDGSLIKNIDTDENSQEIVRAIISFAKTLHVKTIAEFVCSKDVYEKCLELGIDEFQGFYLGEPKANLI
ncbi:EAL domain-containing protein [Sulfurospirillum sp. 1307]